MPFQFDLEALRIEHDCNLYFETGLWDPRTDVSSKHALRSGFEHVFCIEIRPDWVELGKQEFKDDISKGRYHLLLDDSTKMKKYLNSPLFEKRTLFFLDAHVDNTQIPDHAQKCPLMDELDAIKSLSRKDHVILVNDLRILRNPYPWGEARYGAIDFVESIKQRILQINPCYQFKTLHGLVPDDILCAYIPLSIVSAPSTLSTSSVSSTSSALTKYGYNELTPENKVYLPSTYLGDVYRISTNWLSAIPLPSCPMRMLEIGAYHGGNVCSLTKTYGSHPQSSIHCVDPWYEYPEYQEYQNHQMTNYKYFIHNISQLQPEDLNKIFMYRGLSENIVPTFQDSSFDLIYIDGNHDRRYVLHDAIMSVKKIKHMGYIVFDDMQSDEVFQSVYFFVQLFDKQIARFVDVPGQLVLQIKKE